MSGSFRVQAFFCGIVGMKPTSGLVNQKSIFPLAESLDSTDPMTKTIIDYAILMNALQYKGDEDFTRLIGQSVRGMTIGVPDTFFYENIDEEIEPVIRKVYDYHPFHLHRDFHAHLFWEAKSTLLVLRAHQL